jgi:hypothetical protein
MRSGTISLLLCLPLIVMMGCDSPPSPIVIPEKGPAVSAPPAKDVPTTGKKPPKEMKKFLMFPKQSG